MQNTEILANVMLCLMAVALLLAVAAVVWSSAMALRKRRNAFRRGEDGVENGVPVRRIALLTSVGTAVLLLFTFALGSSQSVMTSGKAFTNAFWLRAADMFIFTSAVLMLVAGIAYAVAVWRER